MKYPYLKLLKYALIWLLLVSLVSVGIYYMLSFFFDYQQGSVEGRTIGQDIFITIAIVNVLIFYLPTVITIIIYWIFRPKNAYFAFSSLLFIYDILGLLNEPKDLISLALLLAISLYGNYFWVKKTLKQII